MKVVFSLCSRLLGTVGQLLLLYLVSAISVESLGSYLVMTSWVYTLAMLSSLGLHTYVLKECSIDGVGNDHDIIFPVVVIVSLVSFFVAFVASKTVLIDYGGFFGSIVALTLVKVISEYLKARNHSIAGVFFEYSIVPAFMCALLYFDVFMGGGNLFYTFEISCFSSLCLAGLYCFFAFSVSWRPCSVVGFLKALDCRSLFWMFLNGWINNLEVYIPVILVSYFFGDAVAAEFGVGARVSFFVFTLVSVVVAIYAPKIRRAYVSGDNSDLKSVYNESRVVMFALFFPVVVFVFLFGDFVIDFFIKGSEAALLVMQIMIFGKIVVAFFGPVDYLSVMTGRSRVDVLVAAGVFLLGALLVFVLGVFDKFYASVVVLSLIPAFRYLLSYKLLSRQVFV